MTLLSVRDLRVTAGGVPVVRGLSFDVAAGSVLAVVGESGAGKSLAARAVLGLLPPGVSVTGSVRFDGQEMVGSSYRSVWGRRMSFVPQDALSVLSPVHSVGDQIARAVRSVQGVSRKSARSAAVAALDRVGIPSQRAGAYPHEFSGGMRQRAVIAMATVNNPSLVIADEPTTALDPALQEHVLSLLVGLRSSGTAVVLVTHDLAIAEAHASDVLVMYAGRHVESGPVSVLSDPRAPYTAGLLASLRPTGGRRLPTIGGVPVTPNALPPGCAFAPRCPAATDACSGSSPEPRDLGHLVSCHRVDELPSPVTALFGGTAA